jgi:hypothetical protein
MVGTEILKRGAQYEIYTGGTDIGFYNENKINIESIYKGAK